MSQLSNQTTLIYGGDVVTQNANREIHEAMVTKDGKVVATGSYDDMSSLAGTKARRINIEGNTVIPGLIDNHPHAMHYAGWDAGCVWLYDCEDHAEIFKRIKERVNVTPKGQWILTTPVGEAHYFLRRSYKDLKEGRLPNRWELDKIAPDHPVWMTSLAPVEPNCCSMNSLALKRLNFDKTLPDFLDGVHIGKDENGELTGIFWGKVNRYYNMSYKFWLPRVIFSEASGNGYPGVESWKYCGLRGQQCAASRGVTTVFEGHAMHMNNVQAYIDLHNENLLRMRTIVSPEVALSCNDGGLSLSEEGIVAELARALAFQDSGDDLFSVVGCTLPTGEAVWPGNMRLGFPYPNQSGQMTNGVRFCSTEWQKKIYEYCMDNKLRLSMLNLAWPDHDEFFDMVEKNGWADRIRDLDWITVHNHFINEDEIRKYGELNMQATTTCSFIHGKADLDFELLQATNHPELISDIVPIGKWFKAGVNVGMGSDWQPQNMFEHMAICETRETGYFARHLDYPGNALTRQQAFDGWTVNNAKLLKKPLAGSLEPGKYADFVIVDRNPLTCSIEDLATTKVLKTVLDGEDIFDLGVVDRLDEKELEPERCGEIPLGFTLAGQHGAKCTCERCRDALDPTVPRKIRYGKE